MSVFSFTGLSSGRGCLDDLTVETLLARQLCCYLSFNHAKSKRYLPVSLNTFPFVIIFKVFCFSLSKCAYWLDTWGSQQELNFSLLLSEVLFFFSFQKRENNVAKIPVTDIYRTLPFHSCTVQQL